MKNYLVLLLLVLFSSLNYSQSNERFRIVIVDKLDPADRYAEGSKMVDCIPFDQPNNEKSILMLDTQTGRTWILTKIMVGESLSSTAGYDKVENKTMVWQEILYMPLINSSRTDEIKKVQKGELIVSPLNNKK
jgi:hypothetical protein